MRSIPVLIAVLAVLAVAASALPAWAESSLTDITFDTATASVQQGLLAGGPNTTDCDIDRPGIFSHAGGDPGADHLYQAYELYDNGPARCVEVSLSWVNSDCELEIGLALYLGSFDPSNPTLNLLGHSYEGPFHTHAGHHYDDYRHSPGYYRDLFQTHFLDHIGVEVEVPAYARVVAVLNTTRTPAMDPLVCPRPGGHLRLFTENLTPGAPEIQVSNALDYEFGPAAGDGGTLAFGVHLSVKSDLAVSVDYATVDGTALAGSDYVAAAGTLTFQPGQTFRYVDVDIVGDAVLEPDRTMSLELSNPSLSGFVIVDDTAIGTIHDDDGLVGTCHIVSPGSLPSGKVGEPYGPVDLVPDAEVAGDFEWSLVDPSCLPPGLTLGEGALEHGVIEGTPTAAGTFDCMIHLLCPASDSSTETVDTPRSLFIEPEAPQVLISLSPATVVEQHAGTTQVLPTLQLDPPPTEPFELEVVLLDGTGQLADSDYVGLPPGQLIGINAGEQEIPIPLAVVGDTTVESDEVFFVQLRTPIGAEVVGTTTVTIVNNDALEVVAVPTLAGWGLLALAALLGCCGALRLRGGA